MKIEKKAAKALSKMPMKMRKRFFDAFDAIENNDIAHLDIKSMTNSAYKRLRIGEYRAIYTKEFEVIVIDAGPRGGIYK